MLWFCHQTAIDCTSKSQSFVSQKIVTYILYNYNYKKNTANLLRSKHFLHNGTQTSADAKWMFPVNQNERRFLRTDDFLASHVYDMEDMHDMNRIAAMSDMHAVYICILYIYIYINDYPIHDDAWLAAVANHHMNTKALQTGHMKAFGRTRYLWRCVCPTKPNLVRRTRRILEDPPNWPIWRSTRVHH